MANRHTYEVQKVQPTKASIEPCGPTGGKRGSCVLLHGWDADGNSMKSICTVLHPLAAGWNLYVATYETHTESFVDAARDLRPLVQPPQLASPLILIGYSEGGVVARQMIAGGLPVSALVTICTPHLGIGPWLPTPDLGSASVSPFSPELKALKDSAGEGAQRHLYHCFGITCTDFSGNHPDDGVVPIQSAIAETLGAVAEQVTIPLDYNGYIAGWGPHLQGMNPKRLQPVLNTCSTLFK
ncbi:esterase/lipase family protein [Bradyrhizobium canariense]|uniref:Pimeloyl-ACP methyl ester carboxylesterase n=1 Tax=Bradyrhizobium canariense TaxID=255045 RepID=A0A1H1XGW8_9BRAD|nr:alpha/beta hydrolase [Bradyrhizobium canariense]SDT08504.1 Pimeloyl-ACP methyl ester carboxylesterase [Bradyrhizobium canariense]